MSHKIGKDWKNLGGDNSGSNDIFLDKKLYVKCINQFHYIDLKCVDYCTRSVIVKYTRLYFNYETM